MNAVSNYLRPTSIPLFFQLTLIHIQASLKPGLQPFSYQVLFTNPCSYSKPELASYRKYTQLVHK